jgi:hypothetical protein
MVTGLIATHAHSLLGLGLGDKLDPEHATAVLCVLHASSCQQFLHKYTRRSYKVRK